VIRSRLSIVRSAFAAISVRLVVLQSALAILVFLIAVFWLRLSDANVFSIAATILIGLLLLALASGGEMALMLWLCNRPRTRATILKGAVILLVGVALWFAWDALADIFRPKYGLLAGYLNSRFPASLRHMFSYSHIYDVFDWIERILRWIGAGAIAVVVYSVAASVQPARAVRRTLLSPTYWIVLVFGALAASKITDLLTNWTPGHGLSIEMLSLILRLSIVLLLDAWITLFILAVTAACIQQVDTSYKTPEGGPDVNQPFTAEAP
jgi:hypothetical protein